MLTTRSGAGPLESVHGRADLGPRGGAPEEPDPGGWGHGRVTRDSGDELFTKKTHLSHRGHLAAVVDAGDDRSGWRVASLPTQGGAVERSRGADRTASGRRGRWHGPCAGARVNHGTPPGTKPHAPPARHASVFSRRPAAEGRNQLQKGEAPAGRPGLRTGSCGTASKVSPERARRIYPVCENSNIIPREEMTERRAPRERSRNRCSAWSPPRAPRERRGRAAAAGRRTRWRSR